MSSPIDKLRLSPLAAWAGPLILFLGIMLLPSFVKVDTAGAVWWRRHPEQWAYPLQTIAAAAWLWICRAHYRSTLPRPSQLALAALMGLLGIALWILPGWLFSHGLVPEIKWLGCTDRLDGFDPSIWDSNPAAWWSALALRFIRMTLVVPLVEETFWRGFLWRTVSDPDREFHTLPHGLPQAHRLALPPHQKSLACRRHARRRQSRPRHLRHVHPPVGLLVKRARGPAPSLHKTAPRHTGIPPCLLRASPPSWRPSSCPPPRPSSPPAKSRLSQTPPNPNPTSSRWRSSGPG